MSRDEELRGRVAASNNPVARKLLLAAWTIHLNQCEGNGVYARIQDYIAAADEIERLTAQAIEAGAGETEGPDPQGESAVPEGMRP